MIELVMRNMGKEALRRLGAFVCGICDELSEKAGSVVPQSAQANTYAAGTSVDVCATCFERHSEEAQRKQAELKRQDEHRRRMDEISRERKEWMDKFLEKSIPLLSVTHSSSSSSYKHSCAQAHDDLMAATNGRFGTRRR